MSRASCCARRADGERKPLMSKAGEQAPKLADQECRCAHVFRCQLCTVLACCAAAIAVACFVLVTGPRPLLAKCTVGEPSVFYSVPHDLPKFTVMNFSHPRGAMDLEHKQLVALCQLPEATDATASADAVAKDGVAWCLGNHRGDELPHRHAGVPNVGDFVATCVSNPSWWADVAHAGGPLFDLEHYDDVHAAYEASVWQTLGRVFVLDNMGHAWSPKVGFYVTVVSSALCIVCAGAWLVWLVLRNRRATDAGRKAAASAAEHIPNRRADDGEHGEHVSRYARRLYSAVAFLMESMQGRSLTAKAPCGSVKCKRSMRCVESMCCCCPQRGCCGRKYCTDRSQQLWLRRVCCTCGLRWNSPMSLNSGHRGGVWCDWLSVVASVLFLAVLLPANLAVWKGLYSANKFYAATSGAHSTVTTYARVVPTTTPTDVVTGYDVSSAGPSGMRRTAHSRRLESAELAPEFVGCPYTCGPTGELASLPREAVPAVLLFTVSMFIFVFGYFFGRLDPADMGGSPGDPSALPLRHIVAAVTSDASAACATHRPFVAPPYLEALVSTTSAYMPKGMALAAELEGAINVAVTDVVMLFGLIKRFAHLVDGDTGAGSLASVSAKWHAGRTKEAIGVSKPLAAVLHRASCAPTPTGAATPTGADPEAKARDAHTVDGFPQVMDEATPLRFGSLVVARPFANPPVIGGVAHQGPAAGASGGGHDNESGEALGSAEDLDAWKGVVSALSSRIAKCDEASFMDKALCEDLWLGMMAYFVASAPSASAALGRAKQLCIPGMWDVPAQLAEWVVSDQSRLVALSKQSAHS